MSRRLKMTAAVVTDDGERIIGPVGRNAWALQRLMQAGDAGCTSLENPAPRWAHYVFRLRREFGLDIETITESHGGPFAGHHARYVLRDVVRIIEGGV